MCRRNTQYICKVKFEINRDITKTTKYRKILNRMVEHEINFVRLAQ